MCTASTLYEDKLESFVIWKILSEIAFINKATLSAGCAEAWFFPLRKNWQY
jgi:hypothetical protein